MKETDLISTHLKDEYLTPVEVIFYKITFFTISMFNKGNSSCTFSGVIRYCSVGCQPARVIWYLNSSTLVGVEAILMLPG